MRYLAWLRAACLIAAASLLPLATEGQTAPEPAKALVYCPVGLDAVGCTNISAALAESFPGGVDLGYDGTGGTVDLRSADLWRYEVFVIPSLADVDGTKPYALLRDAAVAERLHDAVMGRIAMWSGTPDLGSASSPNRDLKNRLIVSLATWASGNYAAVKGPGLVTFLDQSEEATERYDWVRAITGVNVAPDLRIASYAAVTAVTPTAASILASGDALLAYSNMASFGFQLPSGAAGVSLDAIGSTGTTVGGQVVLLTAPGGNTAGATVKTDLDDYAPGTTVVMTGSGWQPGETVTLRLHEDPIAHSDRSFTTVADASGSFEFTGFAPEEHDIDVRFILTATGTSSGFRAQTTFTDGIVAGGSTTSDNALGSTTLALGKPLGTAPGDVLLAQITFNTNTTTPTTLAPPSGGGWMFVRRDDRTGSIAQAIYYKIVGEGEPTSYSWGFSIPTKAAGGIVRYSGADISDANPIAGHNGQSGGGATPQLLTAPSVTPTVPPTTSNRSVMVVTFFGTRAIGTTLTTPALMTERHHHNNPATAATVSAGPTIMASDLERFEATATGTFTSTSSVSAAWVAQTVVLDWRQVGTGGTSGTLLSVSRPLEATEGDLLLANIMVREAGVAVNGVPAGWQQIARRDNSTVGQITYWKVATSTEPATYTWTLSAGVVRAVGAITAYSNIDRANPIDAFATNAGSAEVSTPFVAPSVTTTSPGSVVAALYAVDANSNVQTAPAGMVQRYLTSTSSLARIIAYDAVQPAVGVSGTKTLTPNTAARWVAQTIALRRPVPVKLAFLTPARSGFISECLGPITIQTRDTYDRPANVAGATTVSVATNGAGGFFTSAACTSAVGSSITIGGGTNSATVYYKAIARGSGVHQLTASATGLATASQDQAIENDPVAPTMTATVVRTTATSQFSTPSPDPSGIAYVSHLGRLAIVDGEIDEMALYSGANVFEATPSGDLVRAWGAASFSSEPVGAAYNPTNRHLFVSDDVKNRVFEIDPAGDAEYGTADDRVTSFGTLAFGSNDPEGLAFDPVTRTLFIVDGGTTEIYRVTPGANGIFDGVAPEGDDEVSSFDTEVHGLVDPEGLAFGAEVGRLYAVGRIPRTRVFEFSTAGALLNVIDISTAAPRNPAGLEYIPATGSAPRSLFIVDRGVDNVTDPNQNDGKMYEFSLPPLAANQLPVVTITSPASGTICVEGTVLNFSATATDAEDGDLVSAVTWSSNRDGALGTGGSLSIGALSIGTHIITASVKDRRDGLATATVEVTVNPAVIPTAVSNVTASPSTYGGTTDLTATVSPAAPGSVIFLIDGRAASIAASYDPATGVATASGVAHDLDARGAAYGVRAIFTSSGPQYTGSEAVNASALQVSPASQVVTFDLSGVSARYGDAAIDLAARATGGASGNPVTFTSGTPATCDITSASQVRLSSVGTCSITASQAGNANYTAAAPVSQSFTIAPRTLTITATGVDKAYDGTDAATVTLADDRVAGDDLSVTYTTAAFNDASVGAAKPIAVNGIALTGSAAGNYAAALVPGATASISPLSLDGTIVAEDKTYDGTTAAVATPRPLTGTIAGDAVALVATNARFDSRNVGARAVTADIALTGAAAGNYVLGSQTATAAASIGPKTLAASFTAASRTYDRTATANVESVSLDGVVTSDAVVLEATDARFADANAGAAKQVTASMRISGADAGNYTVNATATATADILPKTLAVSATGIDKPYDATTAATVTLADDRFPGDDLNVVYTGARFADANVGTAKPIAVSGISITGADQANYSANASATATASITALSLTGSIVAQDKVYDGDIVAGASGQPLAGALAGDVVTLAVTNARFDAKHVGTRSVTADLSLTGAAAGNYVLTSSTATTSAAITPKALVGSFVAESKVYDGTVTGSAATTALAGLIAPDAVTLEATNVLFDSKHAAAAKTVRANLHLAGADAGNYTVNATAEATAAISPRALAVSAAGSSKTYDGTTAATVTLSDNRLTGDVFDVGYSAANFADAHVGTGKAIAVEGIALTGADAANYAPNATAAASANIGALTITGAIVAEDKIYDGTTAATATGQPLAGLIAGDAVTLVISDATFDAKNVGTRTVAANLGLGGAAAQNYVLAASTATASANITAKALVGSFSAASRTYDGTAAATVTATALPGVVAQDAVTLQVANAVFDSKAVGTGKPVTASLTLVGSDVANYTVNATAVASANITPRPLTVSATGTDKVYDGSASAVVMLADDRVAGDLLTAAYTAASFNDANAGTGKPISVTGISIAGGDAGNYTVNGTASAIGSISARPILVAAEGAAKVYGEADPTFSYRVAGGSLVAGDAFAGSLGRVAGETVAGSPYAIQQGTLSAGANYQLGFTGADLTISRRPVTAKITAADKVYDGGTAATIVASVEGSIPDDEVQATAGPATFADKHVGNAKLVSATGISLTGPDADNYSLASTTAATTAAIMPRALVISATADGKVYDGTTTATVTLSDDRLAGDILTLSHAGATFADANAGSDKAVTVAGISINGGDAGNYTANTNAVTVASIAARPVMVRANAATKVYGEADPTFTYELVSGSLVAGESFGGTLDRATGETVSGSPYAITRGSLTAGSNYDLGFTNAALSITPRTVTARITATDKIYDATSTATVTTTLDGALAADDVAAIAGGASFADANVGVDKQVTATGVAITGAGAGNYALASGSAATTADITPRPLTITATGQDKEYDGSPSATVTLADDRLAGDAVVTAHAGATFSDANVGSGKAITVSGISLVGEDATNYSFNTTATATASITPRAIAVAADPASKLYGTPDPVLTYRLTAGALAAGDAFSGSLSRVPGETTSGGPYAILQGSLTAGGNYALAFSGSSLVITNPVPVLATSGALAPATIRAGEAGVTTLTVSGSGFTPDSKVTWNDSELETQFVSGTQLSASIPLANIASPVTAWIKVVNAAPGGGLSAPAAVFVLDRQVNVEAAATQTSTDPNGSVVASIQGMTATASGAGTLTVARFASDPGATPTTLQTTAGFFDVAISSASFSEVEISLCAGGALAVQWWTGTAWERASNVRASADGSCAIMTVNATTRPSLTDLTRTPIVIGRAAQSIVFPAIAGKTYGDAPFQVNATATSGLPVTLSVPAGQSCTLAGSVVTMTGIGDCTITASQDGNGEYAAAASVSQTFNVAKQTAVITLGNLSQRWDGLVKTPTAVTTPAGLPVTFTYTYNGSPVTAAQNAGFYEVTATVNHPSYQGEARGTLVILNLIDIIPSNSMNAIMISDTKTTEIMTAVLGTATFDARTVTPASVTLGDGVGTDAPVNTSSTGALRSAIGDVNYDGRPDLVLYFKKTTVLTEGSVTTKTTALVMRGKLANGASFMGTDKVVVYP